MNINWPIVTDINMKHANSDGHNFRTGF